LYEDTDLTSFLEIVLNTLMTLWWRLHERWSLHERWNRSEISRLHEIIHVYI